MAISSLAGTGGFTFLGAIHCTSRNMPSLTAHVAHTTPSKLLISLDCRSYPSLAKFEWVKGFETSTSIFTRHLRINTVIAQNLT